MVEFKAGRLVGFADCYAVIVLADNAKFLLAVNRIAAFWSYSEVIDINVISSCGAVGRASALQPRGCGFESHLGQDFSTCLCPLHHTRSVRNYPTSASAEGQLQNRTALTRIPVSKAWTV